MNYKEQLKPDQKPMPTWARWLLNGLLGMSLSVVMLTPVAYLYSKRYGALKAELINARATADALTVMVDKQLACDGEACANVYVKCNEDCEARYDLTRRSYKECSVRLEAKCSSCYEVKHMEYLNHEWAQCEEELEDLYETYGSSKHDAGYYE